MSSFDAPVWLRVNVYLSTYTHFYACSKSLRYVYIENVHKNTFTIGQCVVLVIIYIFIVT